MDHTIDATMRGQGSNSTCIGHGNHGPIRDEFGLRNLRAIAPEIRNIPALFAVTADRSAHLDDLTFDPRRTASSFVPSTGADQAWSRGDYGAGVGVFIAVGMA